MDASATPAIVIDGNTLRIGVKRIRLFALALLIFLLSPAPSFAWSAAGHEIVARIAARELTPAARSQVQELFRGDTEAAMVEVSTWADEVRRSRPATAPWHFVNIPIGSSGYRARRDCLNDDCVVAQIDRNARIFGDRQLLPAVRAEALRFLIHFVGDIHQPLHASNNGDRGGNGVAVVLEGRRTNLHAVWDGDVVNALGRNPRAMAASLERGISAANRGVWQSGSAAAWANESFAIARDRVYSGLRPSNSRAPLLLDPGYAERQSSVVRIQLQKAGVRLAAILNEALR